MTQSLFGHLAMRFAGSPENMATEALAYIFGRSRAARVACSNLLNQLGAALPNELRYETQSGGADDPGIPDLAGLDESGEALLLGEVKFWAGLTDNQPVTYLERLKKSRGQCLVFISPSQRIATLWPELLLRIRAAGIPLEVVHTETTDSRAARIEGARLMLLLSWRALLTALHQALETEGERETLADLDQLRGLSDRMDDTAFLPLQSEELTGQAGRRCIQYCDLVDEMVNRLVEDGGASLKGVRATAGRAYYTRYLKMQGKGCGIMFEPRYWQSWRPTPIWLTIMKDIGTTWVPDPEARKQLVSLELEEPPRLFQDRALLVVPILLAIGAEKAEVVRNAVAQVKDVLRLLEDPKATANSPI